MAKIAWTRVHAISDLTRARNGHLSGRLDGRHVEGSESSDHHRGSPVIDRDRSLHQDLGTIVIFIQRTKACFVRTVGSPSDERRKGSMIMRSGPPNLPDFSRTATMEYDLLSLQQRVDLSWALDPHRTDDDRGKAWSRDQTTHLTWSDWTAAINCVSRSWFDRGPIALRSGMICHGIEATITTKWSFRSHDRSWPSIRSHERIKRPQKSGKNSL